MKNKREAADILGISVRTLERYTQKKQIPFRFEKGRRRPRVVFDDDVIAEFKARMDDRRVARSAQAISPTAMQRVGFRLDPEYLQRLEEQSAQRNISPGDYARALVISGLEDFRGDGILAAQESIHDDVSRLQADLEELRASIACIEGVFSERVSSAIAGNTAIAPLTEQVVRLGTAVEQLRGGLSRLAQGTIHDELRQLRNDLGRLSPAQVHEEVRQLRTEVTRINPAAMQAEVHQMRSDLVKAVQVILLNVFEDRTEEEVRNWVAATFGAPR